MYFQNFSSMLQSQSMGDGTVGWTVPMDPAKRCVIHSGDVSEVGRVVARSFESRELVGQRQHLAVAPGVISWNDVVDTLNAQGHQPIGRHVPPEVYDTFYPGVAEMRAMYQWFERCTYFGPNAEQKLSNTRMLYPERLTP